MTAPDPAKILDALAAEPLDVHGLAAETGINVQVLVRAMKQLEEAGTVALAPSGIYTLTDAGRSAAGDALVASLFPQETGAAILAEIDAMVQEDAAALVASIDADMARSSTPGYVVVQRVERGVPAWTNPDAEPGLVASLADKRAEREALVASAAEHSAAVRYPSPWPVRRPLQRSGASLPASRTVGGGSARPSSPKIAKARALIASAAASLDAAPDGTTLRLDLGRVR